MAENQSPRPANTPEHGKSKPILSEAQPLQQQRDNVESPPALEKKDQPEGTSGPQGTPEKRA